MTGQIRYQAGQAQKASPALRLGSGLTPVRARTNGPFMFEGTMEALVDELRPALPLHVFRPAVLEETARRFLNGFPGRTFYAVKVNPDRHVLQTLFRSGVKCFDVASIEEVRLVRKVSLKAEMAFMHPVKSREAIFEAYHKHGVRTFALDSVDELHKIMQETELAGDLTLFVRMAVSEDARTLHSLSGKFGATPEEVVNLLQQCRAVAARIGVTFHVGSQCMDPALYKKAIAEAGRIIRKANVKVDALDVGGGFPVEYPGMTPPPLQDFFDAIIAAVEDNDLQGLALIAEPGRAMVAEAGSLITRVELRKNDMLYLNDGTYGGLFDAGKAVNFRFPCRMIRPGAQVAGLMGDMAFRLAGPTCDSIDMMEGPFMLPAEIDEGDWVEFKQMGAYSLTMHTNFNSFGRFATVFLK